MIPQSPPASINWLIGACACSLVHCSTGFAFLDPLGLSQKALEGTTPVVEGAEFSRASIQWKQRFTSSAVNRTAHFPKGGDIILGVYAIVSSFLAKSLASFDC